MADLVLYDGVCGLCNRLNWFILERDSADRFRFASLQGALAHELLLRYGRDADELDTLYVIANYGDPGEVLLAKSLGVLFVLRGLGGIWSTARLLEWVPSAILDVVYDWVARRRYLWFGRYEACLVPREHDRAKFLDTLSHPSVHLGGP